MLESRRIKDHLFDIATKCDMQWFITIPFTHVVFEGQRYPANKTDTSRLSGLVAAYANALSIRVSDKTGRQKVMIPFIAVPEYKTKTGDNCHPHFHCLVRFPKGMLEDLLDFTFQYWHQKGQNYCGSPIIPHFETVYDRRGVSDYCLKWLDDELSLGAAIVRGIELPSVYDLK